MEWVCNAAKHSVICPSLRVFVVCYSQIKEKRNPQNYIYELIIGILSLPVVSRMQ